MKGRYVIGNLITMALKGEFDVIIHGCNCQQVMGGGIARTIADLFPEAFEADKNFNLSPEERLGNFSSVVIERGKNRFRIVNAYTQFNFSTSNKEVSYDAVDEVFEKIYNMIRDQNLRIGYPAIGAGLGGGDWNAIKAIIDSRLKDEDHTYVKYDGSKVKGI